MYLYPLTHWWVTSARGVLDYYTRVHCLHCGCGTVGWGTVCKQRELAAYRSLSAYHKILTITQAGRQDALTLDLLLRHLPSFRVARETS